MSAQTIPIPWITSRPSVKTAMAITSKLFIFQNPKELKGSGELMIMLARDSYLGMLKARGCEWEVGSI